MRIKKNRRNIQYLYNFIFLKKIVRLLTILKLFNRKEGLNDLEEKQSDTYVLFSTVKKQ